MGITADLSTPLPSDLFLAIDRITDVLVSLKPDQPMTSIVSSKPWIIPRAMLLYASPHTIRYPDIRDMSPAGDNIDVVIVFHYFSGLRAK
ncbi:MAG TPA: hypothetical protein VMB49_13505 [Acidobacteriaceae bacterium]|nr:hypothetical protein [Acidobacteriaceae bacterium]